MSSFFNRQPELFDAKKRLGSGGHTVSVNNSSASALAAADLLVDDAESAPESWVELAPSRQSLCSSVEAIALADAVGNGGEQSKDSRLSPVSLQSPKSGNSNSNDGGKVVESSLEQVKYRLAKDTGCLKGTTDWIWDWSSRPEAHPNRMLRNRSDNGTNDLSGNAGIGSTLTTPPNSPVPEHLSSSGFQFNSSGSTTAKQVGAKSESGKSTNGFLRIEVIMGLVVSNIVGLFVGFYLCKKWSRGQQGGGSGSLLGDNCLGSGNTMISYYNW